MIKDIPTIPEKFVPPIELIVENNVGVHDKDNILKEYSRIAHFVYNALQWNGVDIKKNSAVLDVGCGTGRVAARVVELLDESARYDGIDIVKTSIDWCNKAFDEHSNFNFIHAEVFSEFYNPDATIQAKDYRLPYDDGTFDITFSMSLFTHMLIDDVENYLNEKARVLKPGGVTLNSYLLLDEYSEPQVLGPRPDGRRMVHEVKGGRIGYLDKPEWVVGLNLDEIYAIHEKAGLEIIEAKLSNWSGGRLDSRYMGQDILIAKKM